MKKTYVAAIAVAALLTVALAVGAALVNSQSPSQNSGNLTVMGTDPPVAAQGVTAASVHYSSVQAHSAGSDMASGWAQVSGSGTLDLMAGQGAATTLATSKVGAGTYDAFRFNVDSAKVTYQGTEYTATTATTTVTAVSHDRVTVNSNSSAAAVVDLRTFVMNTGDTSKPAFIFSASAAATAVPQDALLSLTLQVGSKADLSAQAWWSSFVSETSTDVHLQATMTGSSLHLVVQNSGGSSAEVQEVIITPASASAYGSASLPSSLTGSAVFTVDGSGTVQHTTTFQSAALLSGGANVASGGSETLSYSGSINLDFGGASVSVSGILAGQEYLVTVIGANTYASTTVVAS
jgi:Domain of unknown function (DUF4382)